VKNKLAKSQNAVFDAAKGVLTFTLQQNQSFAVGYFKAFEGYVEAPKLDALSAAPVFSAALEGEPLPSPTSEVTQQVLSPRTPFGMTPREMPNPGQ